jgi:hypothetical protein
MDQKPEFRSVQTFFALVIAISVRILITVFWLSRFGGYWIEGDTSRITVSIEAIYNSGRLIPAQQRIYAYGFLYQIYGTVLSRITGLTVIELQTWLLPFIGIFLTFIAFVFYLHVLKRPSLACFATILLNLQGDFLLTTMRGSHEKLDYILIFCALLALGLTIVKNSSLTERIALAIIYYLMIMAESTTNVFFASTLIVTLLIAFIFWAIIKRITEDPFPGQTRLIYVILTAMIFVFLVIFTVYPPARTVLFTARDLTDRLRLMFLTSTEPSAELYQTVQESWTLPYAWILLRVYDILLLISAGIEWLFLFRQSLKKGSSIPLHTDLFWLLILLPAFAIQNLGVVISDITGASGEVNNLQIRLIPLTVFIAAPLAATFILRIHKKTQSASSKHHWALSGSLAIFIPIIVFLALIKSTSEPSLSNIWLFYSKSESAGMEWLDNFIPRVDIGRGRLVPQAWMGPDSRLAELWLTSYIGPNEYQIPITNDLSSPYKYLFISPSIRLITERFHQVLPDFRSADIIYDNGDVQIYYYPVEFR